MVGPLAVPTRLPQPPAHLEGDEALAGARLSIDKDRPPGVDRGSQTTDQCRVDDRVGKKPIDLFMVKRKVSGRLGGDDAVHAGVLVIDDLVQVRGPAGVLSGLDPAAVDEDDVLAGDLAGR